MGGAFQRVALDPPKTSAVTHNAFKSSSPRLLPDPPDWALFPSPCHYDQLHKAEYRSQRLKGDTENVCFGSATARFTATVDNGSCAPGQYEPRALPKQGGLSLTTVPRLPKPSSAADASGGVVGPGLYPL